MAIYIGFLLWQNYQGSVRLRTRALEEQAYRVRELAIRLSDFFGDCSYDLDVLKGGRSISTFFENEALGMTMEYGLGANVLSITRQFEQLLAQRLVGSNHVYQKIAFIRQDGSVLVEVDRNGAVNDAPLALTRQAIDGSDENYILSMGRGQAGQIMMVRPYYFKSELVGHLVAAINPDVLMNQLMTMGVVFDHDVALKLGASHILGTSLKAKKGMTVYGSSGRLELDQPCVVEMPDGNWNHEPMMAMLTQVPGTDFVLFGLVADPILSVRNSPWQVLTGMIAIAVLVLAMGVWVVRSSTRNMILSASLDQEAEQNQAMQAKNEQLAVEINERHKAEQQLEEINRDLESIVQQRTQELTQAIEDLRSAQAQLVQSEKMAGIGQLAAGIAHEINTPAQYVGDNTRFLQDSFNSICTVMDKYREWDHAARVGLPVDTLAHETTVIADKVDLEFVLSEIPEAIEQSLEGIDQIASIVKAMKEFSHPGSPELELVNLNRIIENTFVVTRNQWKYIAQVEYDLQSDLPYVPCMPGEFGQVVLNLIVNACDAIEDARAIDPDRKGKLKVSTREVQGHVEVRLTDNGCGIEQENHTKVFNPFFTTKEVGRGTGYGLSMCHCVVVDKLNGWIGFESKKGEGTTFIIRLPIDES